jgi:uncharacterized repeat protein (TIGR02543 family)
MGYAYAQVDSLGNVSAANSMNPGIAAVTAMHLSTGSYSVTFPNSGIGAGWAVQVTAYGPKYYGWCWATGWSGGTVNVQCLTVVGGGALFDSPFTVTAFSNTNGQNMAFALTSSPSSPISGADPAHSYNPGGQIYIQRTAVGQYQVVFPGLDVADGGNLQVQAYNTDGHCYPIAWAIPVQVFCTNAGGGAADLNFVIFAIPAGTSPPTLAWAWADQDTAGSYTPNPAYSYNPGGAITVTRSSPGSYVMTFAGFNPAQLLGGNVLVTASESTNTWCIVQSSVQSPAGLAVTVACDGDADGGVPADSNYRVLVFAPLTGIPAVVAPVGGTPQSAVVSTSFATPLAALVIDGNGDPISGIGVTFTAPGSGAGGTFPGLSLSATAATNSSGVATAPAFTANATTGTYSVTASVLGVADTARFSLTNNPVVDYPVTLQTSPANLLVSLNGGGFAAAPVTAQFAAGSNLSIATETPQAGGAGVQYVWQNWSDSGAISHGITVPSSSATYTANFQTQYQLTIAASPSGGGAVTPASGGFFNPATAVPVSATANTGYTFAGWSGPVASASSASTTVTMNAPETVTASFSSQTGITIQTNPPGLQFSVDGGPPQTAPQTLNLSQTNHTIAVATTQTGAGTQNLFTAWSDGGAASHTITVTGAAATYTASFQTQYQLTISALPAAGGSVTPSSGTFYNAAAVVPITATANAGYTFTGWSGSVASPSIASTTATMSAPETVTANFSSLTGITIQTNPPGLQFSVDGGAAQTAPQTLNLSQGSHTIAVATTQAGAPGTQYVFTQWSDGGGAPHSINVTGSPATYTASFQTQFQLSIAGSPAGGGSVTPPSGSFYNAAAVVPITAAANAGYTFTGWSGSVASASNASTTVTMSAPETVTANFSSLTGITIQTNPTGLQFSVDGGAVQTAPQILNLAPGSHTIAVITTQTGAPGTQYLFNGWSDSGAASHAINVTGSPATYTASFTTQYFLLSAVSPAGAGSVAANPAAAGFYNAGTSVQLTASANPGFTFTGWSGDLGGSANPQFLVMNAIHNVTANFAPGSSACSFVLGSSSANLPPTGTSAMETCPNGSGQANCGVLPETPQSFTVTPSAACGPWTATSSNPEFLQLAAGGFSGNGAGAVAYTLLNNTHTLPQTYTITVASGGASAAYTVNQAGSGDSQVYREIYALYEQLLGRDPDAAGFAFWTGSGSAGLGQMADSFLTSPEAFNSDFAVMAAYQASTGAPPTYAQFTAAVASIRAGTQTVPGLFNSLLTPGYSPATLYQNLLNRAPSAGDSSCTSMSLANCFQSIVGFPASATPVGSTNNEFQSTGIYHTTPSADHTNALYVQMIYYVTVSRDPDAGGLSFWTGVANSGGPGVLFQGSAGYSTRIQILGPGTPNQGFIGSPEFQGLFAN